MQLEKKILSLFTMLMILLAIAGCGAGTGDSAGGGSILNKGLSTKSISLAWDGPTTSIDGSSLSDLAGYKIHYGQSGNYNNVLDIGNTTTYNVGNLSSGTWCFSITAYDYSGNESVNSNEVCAQIS